MATGPFSYSKEEGENIIVSETLFDQIDTETSDAKKIFLDLKKLSEKDLKLQMHMTTLSDYWREKMIPRGLRIKKFPSFGFGDIEFKNKWEAILNKCSLDLMLLLIEEPKKQKCATENEITSIKKEISTKYKDQELPFEKEIKEGLDKLQRHIKQEKLAKFKRDQSDYKGEKVYTWRQGRNQNAQIQRIGTVLFQLPSSDDDHSANESLPPVDFLGTRPKKDNRILRRKGVRPDEDEDEAVHPKGRNMRKKNKK